MVSTFFSVLDIRLPQNSQWYELRCTGYGSPLEPIPLGPAGEPPPPAAPAPSEDLTRCSATFYQNGCTLSAPLSTFLDCVRSEAATPTRPVDLGQITTFNGQHSRYSCHFGGRTCKDGSHAVDFGNEDAARDIFRIGFTCTSRTGVRALGRCEGPVTVRRPDGSTSTRVATMACTDPRADHMHFNVANESCGCN